MSHWNEQADPHGPDGDAPVIAPSPAGVDPAKLACCRSTLAVRPAHPGRPAA